MFFYLKLYAFFACVLLLPCIQLYADNGLQFKHLTVEDGLSNSSILSITQDGKGFMWLGTRDGLNRYDGTRVKVYKEFFKNNSKEHSIKINAITEDKNGNLWIGTNNGLYLYHAQKDRFTPLIHSYINTVFKDRENNLWIGTTGGLYFLQLSVRNRIRLTYIQYDGTDRAAFQNIQSICQLKSGQLVLGSVNGVFTLSMQARQINILRPRALRNVNVVTVTADTAQNLWLGSSSNGVFRCRPDFSGLENFTANGATSSLLHNNVRKVFTSRDGQIWIGTLKGLNRYNPQKRGFDRWVHQPDVPGSLNYNSIYTIFEDRQGSLWIGTYFGGVNIIEATTAHFNVYQNNAAPNSLSSNIISAITGSPPNGLWVGTEAEGLNRMDFNTNGATRYSTANRRLPLSNLVKAVFRSHDNNLWIGFFAGGLLCTANEGISFTNFNQSNSSLNSNDITAITEDALNRVWAGHQENGINIISADRKKIYKIREVFPRIILPDEGITCLYKDSRQNIYVGTRSCLLVIDASPPDSLKTARIVFPPSGHLSYINTVAEDSLHRLWIGCHKGLSRYDPQTGHIARFSAGFTGSKVLGIVPAGQGDIWFSTNSGISTYQEAEKRFFNYNQYDGLPSGVFNYNSAYKTNNGKIFFGSLNGLVGFYPDSIKTNTAQPQIILTGLLINEKEITPNTSDGILKENISLLKELVLQYNQSDIAIEYAVMNFIKPFKNASAYQLRPYDKYWINAPAHKALIRNLTPGTYELYIKAANNDGFWSQPAKMLVIKVMPPFWKTWWAYLLYLAVFVTALITVFQFVNSRRDLKRKLHFEHQLYLSLQELQKMKTNFFTYISHELRTPLTLIAGPAEMLADNAKKGSIEEKLATSIQTNAGRMLNLTNNLMDFMKADSGTLKMNFVPTDMVNFSKMVFNKFRLAAEEKQLHYSFSASAEELSSNIDLHYMEIVLTNLLSNAIKFAPAEGKVAMNINLNLKNMVEIKVCDNGPGIPEAQRKHLFTEFFQAQPEVQKQKGSGVGLALSKKIVGLHNGKITFQSQRNNGGMSGETCFTVYLKETESFQSDGKKQDINS